MDQSIEQMQKLVGEDSDCQKPKAISPGEDFHCMYQSLAEHCQQLTEKLGGALSGEHQMQGTDKSECESQESSPLSNLDKSQHFLAFNHEGSDASLSSGSTSVLSLEESGEFSSSFSDSESESVKSISNYKPRLNNSASGLKQNLIELESEVSTVKEMFQKTEGANIDDLLMQEDRRNYDLLLDRIIRAKEDLRLANLKLQISDKEVTRLKSEMEKTEAVNLQVVNMQTQIESAQKSAQEREADLQLEKKRVLELQIHITQLETHRVDSNIKIARLMEDLELTVEKLKGSEEEITQLKGEYGHEISELNERLSGVMRQHDVEKLEMKNLHAAQDTAFQSAIDQLMEELHERKEITQALNKDFDRLKLKYDGLMVEKDTANAEVDTLVAEISSQDNQIHEMNKQLYQLRMENFGLVSGSESLRRIVDELQVKVKELEEEVSKDRVVISDGAEEKREAIRQLCFSLEYYRNEYQQLRRAFTGNKHRPVMAA